jgi:hypothetical protein
MAKSRSRLAISLTLGALLAVSAAGAGAVSAGDNRVYVAVLSGDSEVPANESQGRGVAIFRVAEDGMSIDYRLVVSNISNVTASHIHLAPEGVNGPVTIFLYGNQPAGGGPQNGVLAEGTLTASGLVGPLAGQPLSALIANMDSGNAYVNVHTNDGVAPTGTGPGDLPGGEIRGQIR